MKKGFTLIELLLVIGIIAILAAIVILAINPTKMLAKARDIRRTSNITAILKGSQQYLIDNPQFPEDALLGKPIINEEVRNVCRQHASILDCAANNGVYLTILSFSGQYFTEVPVDPLEEDTCNCPEICEAGCWDTGYTVTIDAKNRITVAAPLAEGDEVISITQ